MRITESALRNTIRGIIRESNYRQGIHEGDDTEAGKVYSDPNEVRSIISRIMRSHTPEISAAISAFFKGLDYGDQVKLMISFKINKDGSVSDCSVELEEAPEFVMNSSDKQKFLDVVKKKVESYKFCGPNESFADENTVNYPITISF